MSRETCKEINTDKAIATATKFRDANGKLNINNGEGANGAATPNTDDHNGENNTAEELMKDITYVPNEARPNASDGAGNNEEWKSSESCLFSAASPRSDRGDNAARQTPVPFGPATSHFENTDDKDKEALYDEKNPLNEPPSQFNLSVDHTRQLSYKDRSRHEWSSLVLPPEREGVFELPSQLSYKDQGRELESVLGQQNNQVHVEQASPALHPPNQQQHQDQQQGLDPAISEPATGITIRLRHERQRIMLWSLPLIFLMVAGAVVLTVLVTNDNGSSDPMRSPPRVDGSFDSFSWNDELRAAVVAYATDSSANTVVAQRYGHPIGTWNVGDVKDMSCIFSASAEDTGVCSGVTDPATAIALASFNEDVSSWSMSQVTTAAGMFYQTSAFNRPLDEWDVSRVTNMMSMFESATAFNGSLEGWGVRQVRNMDLMFHSASSFNQPLQGWDVRQVTTMERMFANARSFDQPLTAWNVGRVVNMAHMFRSASSFNQPLQDWDVSQVTNMRSMFESATVFNGSVGKWDVSRVRNIGWMFQSAKSFNQPLQGWNVSQVTALEFMFHGASAFNQALQGWNTGHFTSFFGLFSEASAFNQPLEGWNVSQVSNMVQLFEGASKFNQPLAEWDVSRVLSMKQAFFFAEDFNQPLSGWNVSQVVHMDFMFAFARSFNQILESWNVKEVKGMSYMFRSAAAFNQALEGWNVSQVETMGSMFLNSSNFNYPLQAWNVGKVKSMESMFLGASSFNQSLERWDVSQVTSLRNMFASASAMNQTLCAWGSKLSFAADVTDMFLNTDACPTRDAPLFSVDPPGPFCHVCLQQ